MYREELWSGPLSMEELGWALNLGAEKPGREGTRGRGGLVLNLNGNGWEDEVTEVRSEDGERGLSLTSLA